MNGIINVYKEKDFTSFDVVAKLRGILKQKKIGHTGTLDPQAQGVLPVCVGKATKVCDLLTDKDKEYEAVLLLGITTDTQDMTGAVLKRSKVEVLELNVRETILSFIGDYQQIPPMYSALKVNGQKLCNLARAGIEVERKARPVTILDIVIQEIDLPRIRMKVQCTKGTYIRTLCQDIGEKLGCGGCMESLIRTRVADFRLQEAHTLTEIEQAVVEDRITDYMYSIDSLFMHYPKAIVKEEYDVALYNGNRLRPEFCIAFSKELETDRIRVYDEKGQFIGIYMYIVSDNIIKPIKIFME